MEDPLQQKREHTITETLTHAQDLKKKRLEHAEAAMKSAHWFVKWGFRLVVAEFLGIKGAGLVGIGFSFVGLGAFLRSEFEKWRANRIPA